MSEFKRTVSTVEEYKEVVKHAEALGFEPVNYYFSGVWEVHGLKKQGNSTWTWLDNSRGSWPKGVEKAEAKSEYFEVRMDRDLCRIKAGDRDSEVTVTFRD